MAKAQLVARLAVEVAPSQLSSIIRRRGALPRMLDTIAEEEKAEAAAAYALPGAKKAPRRGAAAGREAGGSSAAHGAETKGNERRAGENSSASPAAVLGRPELAKAGYCKIAA